MELKMMNDKEEIYIKCPQPVEVATPVNNGLTYILDMFDTIPTRNGRELGEIWVSKVGTNF